MNIKALAIAKSSRGLLQLRKYSPEILTGLGIAGGITSGVMAVKATLDVEPILDQHTWDVAEAKKSGLGGMDNIEVRKAVARVHVRTGLQLAKHYGPTVSLALASAGCILSAHGIMRQRNAAILASYKLLETSFNDYRERVREEIGEESERDFFFGLREEEREIDGEKKIVKVGTDNPEIRSPYSALFDELNPNWQGQGEYNLLFLKAQQNYANDLLRARGHLFLNEVRNSIGLPHTQAGAVTGWVKGGEGDNFVDFGIYDKNTPMALEFVNGNEKSVWLDFNVDGVIYDKI